MADYSTSTLSMNILYYAFTGIYIIGLYEQSGLNQKFSENLRFLIRLPAGRKPSRLSRDTLP